MIKLGGPVLGAEELKAIESVLASGQLVQGPVVHEFEQELSEYLGAPAIAVSSGTAALHVALLGLGIRPGDIVVVPAYSWPATANVVEAIGAQAVFCDISEYDHNLDVASLATVLDRLSGSAETRRRLKAVICVHAFGAIGDMDAVAALCQRYGVALIEDAACAIGSTFNGRQPGSWGIVSCFSFHPRKLLTTAEGGAVTCSDPDIAARIRALRNHGLDLQSTGAEFILPGLNYRMSEIHAAIGRMQLPRLGGIMERRREQAAFYTESNTLAEAGIVPQQVNQRCTHNVQSYVVQLPIPEASLRDRVIASMRECGIETTIGTWHIPMSRFFRAKYGFGPGDFPRTDAVFASSLSLPLTQALLRAEQVQVIEALVKSLRASGSC